MNDRLAGFCLGIGLSGVVGLALSAASMDIVVRVGVVALVGCFALACMGVADWWADRDA